MSERKRIRANTPQREQKAKEEYKEFVRNNPNPNSVAGLRERIKALEKAVFGKEIEE